MELFQRLLRDERTLPKDQPYQDLMTLVKYLLRKFFKAVTEDNFILVEASGMPLSDAWNFWT